MGAIVVDQPKVMVVDRNLYLDLKAKGYSFECPYCDSEAEKTWRFSDLLGFHVTGEPCKFLVVPPNGNTSTSNH